MKKSFLVTAMVIALALSAMAPVMAQGKSTSGNAANSLGKTTLDTTVHAASPNEMNYGSGVPNGEWVTAEIQGVEIGLRATGRTDGLLGVTGTNGNRVGVYEANTGFDESTTDRGNWNYEWSVDLSGATGNAEGRALSDYSLALEQDFVPAFGTFDLPMPDVCHKDAVSDTLCQQSWNPMFSDAANHGYDPIAEDTYNLRLVLTPETFDGPPLAVKIQVRASHDESVVAFGDVTWAPTAGANMGDIIESRFIVHDDESGVVQTTNTGKGTSSTTTLDCVTVEGNEAWLSGTNQNGDLVIFYVKDAEADSVFNQWTDPSGYSGCENQWSGTSEFLDGNVTVIASE